MLGLGSGGIVLGHVQAPILHWKICLSVNALWAWGADSNPSPRSQNFLVRISVRNQVSNGNSHKGVSVVGPQIAPTANSSHSLAKGNHVTLVRIHSSHNQNQIKNRQTLGSGVEFRILTLLGGTKVEH